MSEVNKLIGIPYKLNRKDFGGCDCRGIVCLYYEIIKKRIIPFTDGKRIFFRNPAKDRERIENMAKTIASPVSFGELDEGDIVILKTLGSTGALGVCINKQFVLHMDKIVGSCLTRTRYLKELFLSGFRPL